jgi:DNA repair protein RadC
VDRKREESLPDILERLGESALTDSQLVALLFPRPSSPDTDPAEPGGSLFRRYPSLAELDRASLGELRRQRGVGRVQAARIKAVFEVGRRLVAGDGRKGARFTSSREVADYFRPLLLNRRREVFVAALLNGRHELMREVTVSVGCLTSSIVHPREVFAPAVRESAAAVLFVHNHPSGDPTPSDEDRRLTERLVEAGGILGIKVLDHVVVARGGFVSLLETHP